MEKIQLLKEWINESNSIVFLGGAGVSTESGIADFRSPDGLYNQKYDYPPETILSHSFFIEKPEVFYKFHREKLVIDDAKPNAAHKALAYLEKIGKLKAVITQNIDGLHQAAGSKSVLELHGSVERCYCMKCKKRFPGDFINHGTDIPRCSCGGIVRPDVVLYEEGLDSEILSEAVRFIRASDLMIVGGTSLAVYPAAGLVNYYRGDKLVLINKSETAYDSMADLVISDSIGEVLAAAVSN